MTTLLPKDSDNMAIPALRLKSDGAQQIDFTATSARSLSAFDPTTRVISLYATEPVYIRFGDSTISATDSDHYFPAGVYYDIAIGGGKTKQHSHLAARAVSSSGVLYISEKE